MLKFDIDDDFDDDDSSSAPMSGKQHGEQRSDQVLKFDIDDSDMPMHEPSQHVQQSRLQSGVLMHFDIDDARGGHVGVGPQTLTSIVTGYPNSSSNLFFS